MFAAAATCVVSISFKFRQLSWHRWILQWGKNRHKSSLGELDSGITEVIKYGLIRDADFFECQEKNMPALLARNTAALTYAIKRFCENKAEVVHLDEKEGGVRATLNLGHTFGHAVETGCGYGQWLHGEAVDIGTVMAVDLLYKLG